MQKRRFFIEFDPQAETRVLIRTTETEDAFSDLLVMLEAAATLITVLKNSGVADIDGRSVETWAHHQLNKDIAAYSGKQFTIKDSGGPKLN